MFSQRQCNRDQQLLVGFTCCQANLVTLQVDLAPSEASQIPETLASVEAELDQALPFIIGNAKDRAQFVNREWTPLEDFAVFHCLAFSLACYASVACRMVEAKEELRRAIKLDKDIRGLALDDEDLKPLWDWIAGLE
jgi:hypothetical protein